MNITPLFECNDSRIIDVVKLVCEEHNTRMNVFQRKLEISYAQAVRFVRLLEASGVYADAKHYKMEMTSDGRLKRKYCPYEIIASDDEMRSAISQLKEHFCA